VHTEGHQLYNIIVSYIAMSLPHFHDRQYMKADKVLVTDRLIDICILWMIPHAVTPNHITLVRMLATPIVISLLWSSNYVWGVPLFLIVASTDAIDGALARTRNKITQWGMMFDPLADKCLILTTVIVLVSSNIHWVLACALIFMEIGIMGMALVWRKHGGIISANVWGKTKMFLQVSGVFLLLLSLWLSLPFQAFASLLLWVSIGFGVMSLARHGI